jgi:peptide/nickel transport system permease protein
MLPVLFGVSVVVFLLVHLIPGDPASAMLGTDAGPEQVRALKQALGLDQPLYVQYLHWLGNILHGNLGTSVVMQRPVLPLLLQLLPATLQLIGVAMLIAITLGVSVGVLAAVKSGTWLDFVSVSVSLFGLSMPEFWLGIMAIWTFSLKLSWLPSSGYVPWSQGVGLALKSVLMPAAVLGFGLAASTARFVRSSMLDVIRQDYIRTARAKGLSEGKVIFRHGLKNAMINTLTNIGLQVSVLIGGTPIMEKVFARPGISSFLLNGVFMRDYIVIQGVVLFIAVLLMVINVVVDLLYAVIDPRIRYE